MPLRAAAPSCIMLRSPCQPRLCGHLHAAPQTLFMVPSWQRGKRNKPIETPTNQNEQAQFGQAVFLALNLPPRRLTNRTRRTHHARAKNWRSH
eukprot:8922121-Lingulodinium_polyedra.AAC.1